MVDEAVCPLKLQAEQAPAEAQIIPPCDDELVIVGYSFKGLRTYSIVLIIIVVFSYLAIKSGDVMNMKDLALIAAGYMFGSKVAARK